MIRRYQECLKDNEKDRKRNQVDVKCKDAIPILSLKCFCGTRGLLLCQHQLQLNNGFKTAVVLIYLCPGVLELSAGKKFKGTA